MSSKSKQSLDSKGGKGSGQSRKNNRRRSTRHASVSNGDIDEGKERSNKRGRDPKEISEYDEFSQDVYKVCYCAVFMVFSLCINYFHYSNVISTQHIT